MLSDRFSATFLKSNLLPVNRWHPWPTAGERPAWRHVQPSARKMLLARAETLLKESFPPLPATLYLEFDRTGDRDKFQSPYFKRHLRLSTLALAECLENRGRFLDPLLDILWAIFEESSWSLPAHIGVQRVGCGLPDTTEPIVDLYAAETGMDLAWIWYLLGPQLDTLTPLIGQRLRREVTSRILDPCLHRDYAWMGFETGRVNNWNPWVCSNWLTALLILESDPRRRIESVAKILRCLDVFIKHYPADGGCDEGPGIGPAQALRFSIASKYCIRPPAAGSTFTGNR